VTLRQNLLNPVVSSVLIEPGVLPTVVSPGAI
jgi:hypothetical protein